MTIQVDNLAKRFRLKRKEPGLGGSVISLFKPNITDLVAVHNVSFSTREGELVAFIGPNGAGKSTTIKMLAGLLHPTEGHIAVLGLDPFKHRRQLAYITGSVFGQKGQLWYHLPPIDTFNLFAQIYEINKTDYKKQLSILVDLFELHEIMYTPVRKLSLGQRMKCEVTASLLHHPKLIFLDEPTIGLDIVAKQQIRTALKQMNRNFGTTVFLTSHDPGDVETVCERVIVINDGTIIFDDSVDRLKQQYLTRRTVQFSLSSASTSENNFCKIELKFTNPYTAVVSFDAGCYSVTQIIEEVMAHYPVQDIKINDPTMEDTIRKMYATLGVGA